MVGKFNRRLSQLEAVHQIAAPVLKPFPPIELIPTIKTAIESSSLNVDYEWFRNLSLRDPHKATNFAQRLLEESGKLISKKSILESINQLTQAKHD